MRIYLARHGETFFNVQERMGGDSELTPKGISQAEKVALILKDTLLTEAYCSTLKRSVQTAEIICKYHPDTRLVRRPDLVEILNGDFDNVTYPEFERDFPEMFKARMKDKYHWRFPNGESYETMTERIKPFLEDIRKREGSFLIVEHNGLNRAIIGYLCGLDKAETPVLKLPQDTVFEVLFPEKKIYHLKDETRIEGYRI